MWTHPIRHGLARAALTACAALGAAGAQAASVGQLAASQALYTPAAGDVTVTFNVSNILSLGEARPEGWADPTNTNPVFFLDAPPLSRFVGFGWDVTLTSFGASTLGEMGVRVTNTTLPITVGGIVDLIPAFGQFFPGTGSFSSGGVLNLIGTGFEFLIIQDGKLALEFFDLFDDPDQPVEGRWDSGTLTMVFAPVPEPGTYGLMALGLGILGITAARRRPA